MPQLGNQHQVLPTGEVSSTAANCPVRLMDSRTRSGSVVTSNPLTVAVPESDLSSVDRILTIVVFPAPFEPRRAKMLPVLPRSPRRAGRATPCTTFQCSAHGSRARGPVAALMLQSLYLSITYHRPLARHGPDTPLTRPLTRRFPCRSRGPDRATQRAAWLEGAPLCGDGRPPAAHRGADIDVPYVVASSALSRGQVDAPGQLVEPRARVTRC